MREINEYNFGEVIIADHQLKRSRVKRDRRWIPERLKKETEVMVIGIRRLSNGTLASDNPEFASFIPVMYFHALLVAKGMHSKPFYVLHGKQDPTT